MSDGKIVVNIDPDLEELIPGFLENRQGDVEKLTALMASGDAAAVRKIGHNLKGCGGGYGFDHISDIGARIEACGASGQLTNLPALREELVNYLANVEVRYG